MLIAYYSCVMLPMYLVVFPNVSSQLHLYSVFSLFYITSQYPSAMILGHQLNLVHC